MISLANLKMNAKKVTIITFLLLAVSISSYFAIQNYIHKKDLVNVKNVSETLTSNWFTYAKQSDLTYLNTIKPYLTDDFYTSTEYISLQRPQDFSDQKPSSVVELEIRDIQINKDTSSATVTIVQTESGKTPRELTVYLDLIKTNNKWRVSYLNTSN